MSDLPGQLPFTWLPARLSEIADINPKVNKSEIPDDLEVSFVPMPAVQELTGHIDVSTSRQFAEVKKGYTPFLEGDVLFAKITPCMENGKMAVVPALKNGYGFGSTEFHVVRPYSDIDAKYIYYFVSSQRFRADAEHNMTGAVGQRRVPTLYISERCIPIAPYKEQRRIVLKIEELFSELDKGIEALTIAREQLKVYRQSVLKHAFKGKLTEGWRNSNKGGLKGSDAIAQEIARHKGRDIVRVVAPELPDEWACVRAEDVCAFITKGSTPQKDALHGGAGDIPFIKVYNLTTSGRLDFSVNPTFVGKKTHDGFLSRSKVYPNDVLMNIVGPPLGKVSIVPDTFAEWNINQAIAIFRTPFIRPKVLAHYLTYEGTLRALEKKSKATAGQFNLTLEICRDIPLPVMDCREQEILEERLESTLSALSALETEISQGMAESHILRQSILKKAFSGQLVPQDTKDEPASVLLERIRTERDGAPAKKSRSGKNGKKNAE
ncbi:restriction endonuclease subunit S [Alloacidobacterium sp.]|uniref:restriction endonuclease subunit S n=1 Tax=Alloacidobacterium sp. TaxID=2951999 RepID=UPI002D356913|nr:restriction endonuclease subunit S [Alloacidobacterium sp.]HYK34707.1 restriction endonuclease subunit S [Alloacidobacterium sp.]